jgi:hypothetical protein
VVKEFDARGVEFEASATFSGSGTFGVTELVENSISETKGESCTASCKGIPGTRSTMW